MTIYMNAFCPVCGEVVPIGVEVKSVLKTGEHLSVTFFNTMVKHQCQTTLTP